MKTWTIEQLRKNLQALADQVGKKRYEVAKNLMLDGVVITDIDGNPLDPATIDYTVTLKDAGGEAAKDESAETEAAAKSFNAEVEKAVAAELAKAKTPVHSAIRTVSRAVVTTPVRKRYGPLEHFATEESAFAYGSWMLACNGFTASAEYCKGNGIAIAKAAGNIEGSNSLGGYLVPEQFEPVVIALREKFGVARANCRIQPMTSSSIVYARTATNLIAYFPGEATAGTVSKGTVDQIRLNAHDCVVLTPFSNPLSEDAVIDFAQRTIGEMVYAQTKKEDQCLFVGDGTSTYGGIVGLTAAIGSAGIYTAASTAYAALTLANFGSTVALLPEYADNEKTKIFCTKAVWNGYFQRLAFAGGGNAATDLMKGTGPGVKMFNGYPVIISQGMASSTAAASPIFHIGDMSQAVDFGDRKGMDVQFSDSALNAFESNQLVYRSVTRFDINCCNVGDASTVGSMATLVAGS